MQNGSNAAFNYTYDSNGNILTIKEGTVLKATYTYDKMNQLIQEDNVYSSKSIDYVYDEGGNITSRSEYNYTGGVRGTLIDTYNYGYSTSWKDQMTSFDGQTITYDSVGNPTAYLNDVTLAWQNGRELASYTKDSVTTNYTYNDSGIRTSKKIGTNATITYYLNGSSIIRQTDGTKTLDFFYDENGNLYGFKEAGAMYYYLRNGQNDIIGILDNAGAQVVSYVYDSWGNPISTSGTLALTIGADNPFRYRGYYFDSDTGLYYLNNRYYDSKVGRFINADLLMDFRKLNTSNQYSYCANNPIMYVDESGRFFEEINSALRLIVLTVQVCSGLSSGAITVNDILTDLRNYSSSNTNRTVVNQAKIFTSYNDVFIIKQDFTTSFQYGSTMYLNSEVDAKTLNHEFGHSVQENKVGPLLYTLAIATPSVVYYNIDIKYNLPNNIYYSTPWERTADEYGGVNRGMNYYVPGSLDLSQSYIETLETLAPIFGAIR